MKTLILAALLLAPAVRASDIPGLKPVKILIPDEGNLQLLAFYVAQGAGYFADAGLDISTVSPPAPALTEEYFKNGKAPAALLSAPIYERLIEDRFPFVIAANLLANDAIDLVVSSAVVRARGITHDMPLAQRLRGLHGLKIGVAPHPGTRMKVLFKSQGLDIDALVKVVIVPGVEQDKALAAGDVDALYAHTPFLENAIVDQGAVVVVDQARGDVPELTGRNIHVLGLTRAFAQAQPRAARALVAALARGEALIHSDARAAADAVIRALPSRDRAHVERLIALYAPAVPVTPAVSKKAIVREISFYPLGKPPPDLKGIDLGQFVYEP